MSKQKKFIFVVGGVISGVGKGVTSSSIAKILQARGLKVTTMKVDPYVNVDAGTMNPTEHGEVCVLSDGYETDQDMCAYERFLGEEFSRLNYMTTGSIYQKVIQRERNLEYKGKCVQLIPHVPQEVINQIEAAADKAKADVTVVEIGGTAGEYESIVFMEAARMLKHRQPNDVMSVMVTYLPVPAKVGEMKTKPTQHAVRTINSAGIQPDFIIARSSVPLDKRRKEKISTFCNVPVDHVISAPDVESIYDIPINFEKDHIGDRIVERLGLQKRAKPSDLRKWKKFTRDIKTYTDEVNIAIVGKYFSTGDFVLSDSYVSVIESLKFSSWAFKKKPVIHWLSAEEFEDKKKCKKLSKFDGILVPGGFGERGIEGKINVIEYARKNKIPYFGLCYGMQLLVIEYARNVLGLKDANTVEIDKKTPHPVIDVMPDQKKKIAEKNYGGSMRLGSYTAVLKKGTVAQKAYKKDKVDERHRHRYEVNPEYVAELTNAGLVFSGTSPDGVLMEIAELPASEHPFHLGTQFHPEFQSRPLEPHPLFSAFIKAATTKK